MFEFSVDEIKRMRKRLGVTQSELATKSDVSQSMIAKIESGLLDPTYGKAKKIFETLSALEKKEEKKAKDLIQTNVISVKSSDSIRKTIGVMRHNEISQLPVIDEKSCVGLVSETSLLDAIINQKSYDSLVSEFMLECPPIINQDTNLDVITSLLKHYPLVIVSEKGKIRGVITKADILTAAYKK
ncbi:CBS domain-containing protein [Candidatus Woesearchaeota archaeon]|nr:CBS domain-containing protein [Candidatus Woesearchaeota archaeon]